MSSGKCSLLNHVLHTDVLPVGVNPITAVPTRLVFGTEAHLTVTFADRQIKRYPIGDLTQYASEERNPGNQFEVARLVVRLPSPRLQEGLVLVDTPGLGALAMAGAAETLALSPPMRPRYCADQRSESHRRRRSEHDPCAVAGRHPGDGPAQQTVGKTPMVELGRVRRGLPGRVVAKLEMRNPCGSVKDRVGVALIDDAENRGVLRAGMTIVEATGGNTGIGLAFAAAIRVTGSSSRCPRRRLPKGWHCSGTWERKSNSRPASSWAMRSLGPCNLSRRFRARSCWTSSEIQQTPKFTGEPQRWKSGTIPRALLTCSSRRSVPVERSLGFGEELKRRKPSVRVVTVEPAGAAVLSGGRPGTTSFRALASGSFPRC